MKKLSLFIVLLSLCGVISAQGRYDIIPYPNSLEERKGEFVFRDVIKISFDKQFTSEVELFTSLFKEEFFTTLVSSKEPQMTLLFDKSLESDHYVIDISDTKIAIRAGSAASCFYALQTIRQMVMLSGDGSYKIANSLIKDYPSYSWRAFMLDESRHFKGKEFVKKMIDQMAYLKMNVFHWHLTDDQGWRIYIKKFPLLTQIGAWRDSTQVARVPKGTTPKFYPTPHGGYYTHEDINEIVEYALQRHIMIVPEIEMPGHASAAVAAYPWLSPSGKSITVPCTFGVHTVTYNVADPKVFTFLTDVLSEIMPLFPSKIIHIGGDEVKYDEWIVNPLVKELMKSEGLENPFDVQLFFVNRLSTFIESKGFRMMGWNEILGKNLHEWSDAANSKQELVKSSIVHFWKGDISLLQDAIEKGYNVVNSNHWDTYLDYTYERIPLEKSYNFSPLPVGMDIKYKKNVFGSGCQMWSEYVPKVTDVYRQVFPRIAAYAEVGWSEYNNKNYDRFLKSLVKIKKFWDTKGVTYYDEY